MSNPATEPISGKHEERRFVLRLVLLLILLIAGFLLLAAFRSQTSTSPFPRVKLADGTWLVARAVSVGKSHSIEIPYPIEVRVRRWQRGHTATESTQTDRMMIWLTHENDRGDLLDLDWFGRCELVVAGDLNVSPIHFNRQKFQGNGSSGTGTGSTGFSDATPFKPSAKTQMTLIRFDLPLVRPRGKTMRLDVYDGAKQVVAQLEIPYPTLPNASLDDWRPQPLPATKSDGNVDVTLTSVKYSSNSSHSRLSVSPQLEFVHDDHASIKWVAWHELLDPLGNISQAWNCDLSLLEPAWKLRLTMYQSAGGRFLPEETMKLQPRALTAAKKLVLLSETQTINGTQVSLLGLGGQGPVEFTLPNSTSQYKTKAYEPGQVWTGMSSSCSGNKCEVDFSSGHSFLITNNSTGDTQGHLQMVFRDQSGAELPQRGSSGIGAMTFWFFEPKPDSTAIEVEIIAQKYRHAEFLIAPPKPEEIVINQ